MRRRKTKWKDLTELQKARILNAMGLGRLGQTRPEDERHEAESKAIERGLLETNRDYERRLIGKGDR